MPSDKVAIPSDHPFNDGARVLSDEDLAQGLPVSIRQEAAIILKACKLVSATVLPQSHWDKNLSEDATAEGYQELLNKARAALSGVSAETLTQAMEPFLTPEMQWNLERVPNPYFLPKCRERMEQMKQDPLIRESLDNLKILLRAEELDMAGIQAFFAKVGDELVLLEEIGPELLMKYFSATITSFTEDKPYIFPAVAEEKDLYLYLYYELHRDEPEMNEIIIELAHKDFFGLSTLNLLMTHPFNVPEFAYKLRSSPAISNADLREKIGRLAKIEGNGPWTSRSFHYFLFDKK